MLARTRGRGGRRRRQPRGPRARPAALPAPEPALRARPGRGASPSPCDAIVFLQTIEHIHEPGRLLRALRRRCAASPTSRPRTGSRSRRPGAEKSDNPWHLREYTLGEYRELLEPHFSRVEILGLFHARKLRAHELAIRLGWDRVHPALRITKPFYDRFVPAIAASDFALRADGPRPGARLRRRLPCLTAEARRRTRSGGARAVSRRSRRSSCTATCPTSRASGPIRSARSGCSTPWSAPTCRCSRSPSGVTMTVTPVLADQLEAPGVAERMRDFAARVPARRRRARRSTSAAPELPRRRARPSCDATAARSSASTSSAATRSRRSAAAQREGRVELMASAATHAVLPLSRPTGPAAADRRRAALAPAPLRPGRRLLAARMRLRARARAGCSPSAGSSWLLRRPERARGRRSPRSPRSRPPAGPVALHDRLGGGLAGSGRSTAIPSDPAYARVPPPVAARDPALGDRRRALRPGRGRGGGATAARGEFARRGRGAARASSAASAAARAWSSSRSTPSCSGTGGRRGRAGSREVARGRAAARRRAASRSPRRWPRTSRAARRCATRAGARARTCAPGTRPPVADLAWGARRLELRLLRALAARRSRRRPRERAARELLAVQASDWAFLDPRRRPATTPSGARPATPRRCSRP